MKLFLRRILKSPILLIILFLLSIKPYNWYCASSGSCPTFNLGNLLPHKKGNIDINLKFETRNPYKDVIFRLADHQESEITAIAGVQYNIRYYVRNNSKNAIVFRPNLHIDPDWVLEYIDRENCLCHQEYELEKGEERILESQFRIDSDIDEELKYDSEHDASTFTIRYDIR